MSRRSMEVDFGPLYLNVGTTGGDEPVDPEVLARFERHLGGDARQQRGAFDPSLWQVCDDAAPPTTAADAAADLAAGVPLTGAEARLLGEAIQGLWVVPGADGRELRMNLFDGLLQDTALRMFETGGRLVVAFEAGSVASRDWLSQRLRALAGHLGRRLDRPVRMSLSPLRGACTAGEAAAEAVDWPEAFDE
jgi:hypothetical protein